MCRLSCSSEGTDRLLVNVQTQNFNECIYRLSNTSENVQCQMSQRMYRLPDVSVNVDSMGVQTVSVSVNVYTARCFNECTDCQMFQ